MAPRDREMDNVKMRSGQEEMMRSNIKEGRIRRMGGAMFEEIMVDSILKLMKNMHPSPGSFLAQTRYVVLGQPTLLHTRAPPPAFLGGQREQLTLSTSLMEMRLSRPEWSS